MDTSDVIFICVGALAGGFINGFAGTGTALFALGFFLLVLPPASAVALVALVSVLASLQGIWVVRRALADNLGRFMRFVLPGLAGVPIGNALLDYVDAGHLRLLVAVLLICYGGYFGLRRSLPRFERKTDVADAFIGFGSGVFGGLAALSGTLTAVWMSLRPWPKAESRAVMQPYNAVILTVTLTLLALQGAYTPETWRAFAIALPVALVAAQIGIALFRRVSDDVYRRVLIISCFAVGLSVLLRELL